MSEEIALTLIRKNRKKVEEKWILTVTENQATISNTQSNKQLHFGKENNKISFKDISIGTTQISVVSDGITYRFLSKQIAKIAFLEEWSSKQVVDDFVRRLKFSGYGLIILGVIQFLNTIDSPYTALLLIFVGLMSLYVLKPFMFLIQGAALLYVGVFAYLVADVSYISPILAVAGLFEILGYKTAKKVSNLNEYKALAVHKHSFWGILSFVLAFVSAILIVLIIMIFVFTSRENFTQLHALRISFLTMINTYILIGCFLASLVGKIQKSKEKHFANIGLYYSSAYFIIFAAIYLYGLWSK